MADNPASERVDHYGAQYGNFDDAVLARVRSEAFGEDIGQNSWLPASEQDRFIGWLNLSPDSNLLDVACGSARPTMRIAEKTGCAIVGVDVDAAAIAGARETAKQRGLARVQFRTVRGEEPLHDADATYDALTCVDAINHFPGRPAVLAEWHRVLKPGGRLLFTDPIVISGQISSAELRRRFSIGFMLLTPPGANETMLERAGFRIDAVEDRTESMARNARGWLAARSRHEPDLRRIESDAAFDGQQDFFEVAAVLAEERRLSRYAYMAIRP